MPRTKKQKVSKAQSIRDAFERMGKEARPKDVIAELAKEGVTVNASQVSILRAKLKPRRGRKAKRSLSTATNGDAGSALDAGKVNKSQAIREILKELGEKAQPKEVVAALAEKGLQVTSQQVSMVKMKLRQGPKRGRTSPASAKETNGHYVSLAALVQAKRLIVEAGSIEHAKELIGTLAQLAV